jgi:hypothetical protein
VTGEIGGSSGIQAKQIQINLYCAKAVMLDYKEFLELHLKRSVRNYVLNKCILEVLGNEKLLSSDTIGEYT